MLQSHAFIDIRKIFEYVFSPNICLLLNRSISIDFVGNTYDPEMLEYLIKLILETRAKLLPVYKQPSYLYSVDKWIERVLRNIKTLYHSDFYNQFINKIAIEYPEIHEINNRLL